MNGVKIYRCIGLVSVGAVVLSVLVGPAPSPPEPTQDNIDTYLKLRQDVVDVLQASFQNLHPAAGRSFDDQTVSIEWPPLTKQHVRDQLTHRKYDGQDIQKYLIRLPIDPSKIPPERQRSSLTMVSTEILNHYMAPLKDLGLECRNSPMAAVGGGIQYSAKTWQPKDRWEAPVTVDSPVWVEAQAFYTINTEEMIVRLTVGGRYAPNGR